MPITTKDSILKQYYEANGQQELFGRDNLQYWSVRGLIGMFQRHNTILVVLYLIILFPIAYIHMLILGMFGNSKKERLKT